MEIWYYSGESPVQPIKISVANPHLLGSLIRICIIQNYPTALGKDIMSFYLLSMNILYIFWWKSLYNYIGRIRIRNTFLVSLQGLNLFLVKNNFTSWRCSISYRPYCPKIRSSRFHNKPTPPTSKRVNPPCMEDLTI